MREKKNIIINGALLPVMKTMCIIVFDDDDLFESIFHSIQNHFYRDFNKIKNERTASKNLNVCYSFYRIFHINI